MGSTNSSGICSSTTHHVTTTISESEYEFLLLPETTLATGQIQPQVQTSRLHWRYFSSDLPILISHNESPLDNYRRFPLRRDSGHPPSALAVSLQQDMEQALQVEILRGLTRTAHLLLLRPGRDSHTIFLGRHPRDAKVQR